MAKYSRDLDESLIEKVNVLSQQYGFKEKDIKLDIIRLNKKKTYGEVVKPNDYTKLVNDGKNVVAIALCEDLMLQFDEQMQTILIENLLEQIQSQEDNDGNVKIKIEKPQINIGINTYHRYGKLAADKLETVLLTIEQMAEEERMEKEAQKAERKERKKNKEF